MLSTLPGVIAHVSEELRDRATDPRRARRAGRLRATARSSRRPASPTGMEAGWPDGSVAVTGARLGHRAGDRRGLRRAGRHRARRRHLRGAARARPPRELAPARPGARPRARRHRLRPPSRAFVAAADDDGDGAGGVRQLRRRVRRLRRHRGDVTPELWRRGHRRQPDGLLPRLQGGQRRDGATGRWPHHQHRFGRRRHGGADGLCLRRLEGGDRGDDPAAGDRRRAPRASPPTSSRRASSARTSAPTRPRCSGDLVDVDRGVGTSSDKMDWLIPVGRPGRPDEVAAAVVVPGQRRGRLHHRSGAAHRRRLGRHVTVGRGRIRDRRSVPLPAEGKRLAVSIWRRLRRPLRVDGDVRADSPGYLSRGRVRRRGRRAPPARRCSRATACARRGACPRTRCGPSQSVPAIVDAGHEIAAHGCYHEQVPKLDAGRGAAAAWRCSWPSTSSSSAAARRATGRRRGTSRTPRSACSRSSASSGTRR